MDGNLGGCLAVLLSFRWRLVGLIGGAGGRISIGFLGSPMAADVDLSFKEAGIRPSVAVVGAAVSDDDGHFGSRSAGAGSRPLAIMTGVAVADEDVRFGVSFCCDRLDFFGKVRST